MSGAFDIGTSIILAYSYNECMRSPERKFRQKRHPLCPECKYDLIATVESGHCVCPECGYEFEMDELRGEKRPGDWSPGRGLMIVMVTTCLRAILILPFWTGLIWLITPLLSMFPVHIGSFAGISIGMAIPGIIIGYCFGNRLTEKAGFVSPLITAIALLAALSVIYGGVVLSQLSRPLLGWHEGMMLTATMAFAIAWIIKKTLVDD